MKHKHADPMMAAKIASLQRLKAIDEVQVPEEPIKDEYECYDHYVDSLKDYIDTLRDLLKRESARADSYWENEAKRYAGNADYWRERAEAAEAKLAAIKEQTK